MSKPPLAARKDGTWYAMCVEPSITKTPVGPVQVPVPYQVISDLSKAMGTSPDVKFNGQPAYLLDQSKMMKCMGDEQGTSGGIRSSTTSMEVKPVKGSDSFKINGKSVIRREDPCTLNKGNCKGQYIKATPPSKESSASKEVKVKIIPSQKTACPNGPIELKADVTPAGTNFDWAVSEPFELVDAQGNPIASGAETAHLRLKKGNGDAPARADSDAEVTVSVPASGSKGKAEATTTLPVHSGPVFGAKWDNKPRLPGEIVLGTMEKVDGVGYSVSAGQGTYKTADLPSPGTAATSKLWLTVKTNEAGPDVMKEIKEKWAELPRRAFEIHEAYKAAEEAFLKGSLEFASGGLGPRLNVAVADKVLQLASVLETRAKEFGRTAEQSAAHNLERLNALLLVLRMAFGQIAYYMSGDSSGIVADDIEKWESDQIRELPLKFDYGKGLALVVVSGMAWKYDTTLAMQQTCHYSFDVEKSVRIRNYTNRLIKLGGDVIQSAFSEVFGAIDPHAIVAAVAVSEGVLHNQKAYVVAHSQGSEIVRAALEFTTLMGKIPKYMRRIIVETNIVNEAAKLLMARSGVVVPPRIFDEWMMGVKIAPEKIVLVGEDAAAKLKKTHYQGFGSESFIHPDVYGLGSIRNAKTQDDPVPLLGSTAKVLGHPLSYRRHYMQRVLPLIAADMMQRSSLFIRLKAAMAHMVFPEDWKIVESPVKAAWYLPCCDFDTHDWFKNYWTNLMVPVGGDKPNTIPDLTPEQLDQFGAVRLATKPASNTQGARIHGPLTERKDLKKLSEQKNQAIAIFIDGSGNTSGSKSNIAQMCEAARPYFAEPNSDSKPVVRSKYLTVFTPDWWDPAGAAAGEMATSILKDAYKIILHFVRELRKETEHPEIYPKIDLYGFGRGAAVASELAYWIDSKGLDGKKGLRVRFLGLFDTVHSMAFPPADPYVWQEKYIASNVDSAAVAYAGRERRVYFKASILKPKSGATLKLSELIFPGVHNDIGGHKFYDNNNKMSKLALSWMLQEARHAKVDYLGALEKDLELQNVDLAHIKPGPMDFPDGVLFKDPSAKDDLQMTIIQKTINQEINQNIHRYSHYPDSPGDKALMEHYQAGLPALYRKEPYLLLDDRVFPAQMPRLGPNNILREIE